MDQLLVTALKVRSGKRLARAYPNLLAFIPAMVLFCIGHITAIHLPGVYMDAVNPDYLVVRLLHRDTDFQSWTLPGTLLLGVFPVLGQIYHGAIPFYLGLPAYALFGTGVLGIRIANLVFGLLVLAAAGAFMRAFRVRPIIAALCLSALALDPGFLFTFRTQFYITLLPAAPMLASLALTEYRRQTPTAPLAMLAGFLAGLACYGYFIYFFAMPALVAHAFLRWRDNPAGRRLGRWWIGGLALGLAPYPLGMLLVMIATGGPHGFVEFLRATLHSLAVTRSPLSLTDRLAYFAQMSWWTFLDVGPSRMMLQDSPPLLLPTYKIALLLGAAGVGLIAGLLRPRRFPGLAVCALSVLGVAVLYVMFGNRLWLHHDVLLLPIAYCALALMLDEVTTWLSQRRVILSAVATSLVVVPLLAGNAADSHAVLAQLRSTGGVGLASDALTHFAQDSTLVSAPTRAFFPDWGVFMPFVMLTRGRIPAATRFTPAEARRVLCHGQDVLLAVRANQEPERLPLWIREIGPIKPNITVYRQRDGTPVLTSVRWHAEAETASACAA